jgi:uncharacterized protein YcfJ
LEVDVKARQAAVAGLCAATILSGCAVTPPGPTFQAMAPEGKPYETLTQEDNYCRSAAAQAVQGQVDAVNGEAVGATLFTAILGTALGAAVGGGRGAAIGAAAGAGVGGFYGLNGSQWGQLSIQQRYNVVWARCMSSYGNSIPGYGPPPRRRRPPPGSMPPPDNNMPPPPPQGAPPSPPPGQ